MTEIHPDVVVYLKKLRKFFLKEDAVCKKIFGDHPLDTCLELCKEVSVVNFELTGEPEIRKEQFITIKKELDGKMNTQQYDFSEDTTHLFQTISKALPPICWN